jgi:ribA/ribD-fused uncharacterized protein
MSAERISELRAMIELNSVGGTDDFPAVNSDGLVDDLLEYLDALSRSHREAETGVAVKPLEWVSEGNATGTTWRGISPIGLGRYTVVADSWWGPEPTNEFHNADDVESAKAAAQADYEQRILSALASPQRETEGRAGVVNKDDALRAITATREVVIHSGEARYIDGISVGITRAWNAVLAMPEGAPRETEGREITEEHHKLDNDRQVFFYEQDFYVLSNFSSFNLNWADRFTFPTSEHCYHWLKFATGEANGRLGGATPSDAAIKVAESVRYAKSAHDAFKIAEANKHLRRADWDEVKVDKMRLILRAKADQHEYVRRKLLATGDRELIEDSWRDDFWGWGPHRNGQNMLGKLWMEVRAALAGGQ